MSIFSNCWITTYSSVHQRRTAQQYKPNVICITETWLNENFDANVNLLGYNLYRKDFIVNGSGGGIYVSQSVQVP